MKKVVAIVGAVLFGLLTIIGFGMDIWDGFRHLPDRPKQFLMTHADNVRDGLRILATQARQMWGRQSLGAATASSIRRHMPSLYRTQKGKDALCKNPLPNLYVGIPWLTRKLNPKIEVDHILPKSLGGTNDLINLQLTQGTYNRAKGNKTGFKLDRTLRAVCPV